MGGHKFRDVPRFDGNNYVYLSKQMNAYLMSMGLNIWAIVTDGYKPPKTRPSTSEEIEECQNNATSMNAILEGLSETELFKVMNYSTTKEIWDKLATIYQGDSKVQQAKLKPYRT